MSIKSRRQKLLLAYDKYAALVPGQSLFEQTIKDHARLDYYAFPTVLRDPPVISSEWHLVGASVSGASVIGDGRVGGKLYKAQKLIAGSQCVIMPALQDTSWDWDPVCSDDEAKTRNTVSLQLSPQLLKKVAEETLQQDSSRFELLTSPAFNDSVVYTLLNAIHAKCVEESPFGSIYLDSAVNMLCVHLLTSRNLTSYNSKNALPDSRQLVFPESKASKQTLSKKILLKVHSYILDHLNQSVTLKDLANLSGLSEYHFLRLFKNSTGSSPYQYVIHCRVEQAKHLLSKTTLSITNIAFEVGFDDVSNFSKNFRKVTGFSPSVYRKSING